MRPRAGWQPIDLRELWRYRELWWVLALRDVRVRYKQTVLGAAWAIIQPLLQMVIFVAFFSGFSPPNVVPQLFFFSGLLPWQLFATSLTNASNSLVGNQNLITKVYFPRLVMPIASVVTGLIDFCVAMGIFALMMVWYRCPPAPTFWLFPVFVMLAFLAALAVGLWLSAMNVEYRDIRYVIPLLVQAWMFLTPIIYPASHVHRHWARILLGLNPMSGPVESFRWCILGTEFHPQVLVVSVVMIFSLLISGAFYFRRMEKSFADVV